jgi:hypothetical protein
MFMRLGAAISAIVLSTAACSPSHRNHTNPPITIRGSGTLDGHVHAVGGPPPGQDRPIAGALVAIRGVTNTKFVLTTTTDARGRFQVAVPSGTYDVTATSFHFSGPLRTSVSVRPSATKDVELTLEMP